MCPPTSKWSKQYRIYRSECDLRSALKWGWAWSKLLGDWTTSQRLYSHTGIARVCSYHEEMGVDIDDEQIRIPRFNSTGSPVPCSYNSKVLLRRILRPAATFGFPLEYSMAVWLRFRLAELIRVCNLVELKMSVGLAIPSETGTAEYAPAKILESDSLSGIINTLPVPLVNQRCSCSAAYVSFKRSRSVVILMKRKCEITVHLVD